MTEPSMTESHVQLSPGPIRVRQAGVGPPIVLVHGALVNGHLWDDVVLHLVDRGRVIMPDLPLGPTPSPWRARRRSTYRGWPRWSTGCWPSWGSRTSRWWVTTPGGAICQVVVTRHPSRIGRPVLTSCDAFDNCPPKFFRYLVWASRLPGALWTTAQSMRSPRLARLPLAFGRLTRRGLDRARLDAFFEPLRRSSGVRRDFRRMLGALDAEHTQEAARALSGVRIPVLLAWSSDDPIFPPEHAERLAELLPDATSQPIADSLAFSPIDQPEALATRIRDFVAAHPATN